MTKKMKMKRKMSKSKVVSSLLFIIMFRLTSSNTYFKRNRPISLPSIYQISITILGSDIFQNK